MESYSKLSDHELLYQINKAKEEHEQLKKEGFELADKIQELENAVNAKIEKMRVIEFKYVQILEELTSRQ